MSARHLDIDIRVNGEDVSARVEARKTWSIFCATIFR